MQNISNLRFSLLNRSELLGINKRFAHHRKDIPLQKTMGDIGNRGMEIRLRNAAKDLRRKAELVGGKLQSIAESVTKKYGAKVTPINFKSVDSIIRKAKTENNGIKDIKDSYRTTIIANKESIPKIIKDLKRTHKDFIIERHKVQNLDTGYTGNIINFKSKKTGIVGEIQVKINDLAHNQSRAKKYGFQKQYEKCTTALSMMRRYNTTHPLNIY